MNCEVCNKAFNLTTRLPLLIPCCGTTLCKECVITFAGGQPQNILTFCPINDCGVQHFIIDHLKPNQYLGKLLEKSLGILCDSHPQSQAEYYCPTDNTLVCTECAITTHQSHQCQKIQKQQLINYNDKILNFLRIELARITNMISDIEGYQQNEKQFASAQYLNVVNDAQTSLRPRLNQQQQNDIKFPPFQLKKQYQEEEKKQPPQQQLLNFNQYNQVQQLFQANNQIQDPREVKKNNYFQQVQRPLLQQQNVIDSKLIKQDDYSLLKEYFNTNNLTLQLIYRGTDHGFTVKSFHKRCDNQGPTLTVALSEHDQLFGGYTSISWQSSGFPGQSKQDSEAFLFQLTKKFKLTQYQNIDKAVYHYSGRGPVFGGGNDLVIGYNKDFDKDNSCVSNIHIVKQRTYSLPLEIQNNEEEAAKYLAGSQFFKLKEIEVFTVIIQ